LVIAYRLSFRREPVATCGKMATPVNVMGAKHYDLLSASRPFFANIEFESGVYVRRGDVSSGVERVRYLRSSLLRPLKLVAPLPGLETTPAPGGGGIFCDRSKPLDLPFNAEQFIEKPVDFNLLVLVLLLLLRHFPYPRA